MITWTIGAGGLLGSAIQRQVEHPFRATTIPWNDEQATIDALTVNFAAFRAAAAGQDWAIVWAAGSATVSASPTVADRELRILEALLENIASEPPAGKGVFFLSSSAGGVYAGSSNPPFDMTTTPRSLSPYGDLKLRQEAAAAGILGNTCTVILGRFSNIYGPGQNLGKLQGLISRLALAATTRQPINIFVSLDTIRDYIYVDDAARTTLAWIIDALDRGPSIVTCIIASGQPTVLGQLIRLVQDVARTKVPVALGTHASAAAQVSDLRLIPTPVPTGGDSRVSLPAGVKLVYQDIAHRGQAAELS